MADDTQEEGAARGQRGGVMHAVAVGCALTLALGGVGATIWRLGAAGIGPRADAAVVPAARAGVHPGDGAVEPMDPFIANLSDDDGRRYIKATIQVEFYDGTVPPEFHARLAQTRDTLLTLFSSKTFGEVRSPQGKAVLREEIVNRINTVLNQDAVKAVYFTEFIVQ
jgi:flagellar FliL protein